MFKWLSVILGGLAVLPLAFGAGFIVGVRQHKATVESRAKDDKITILKDGKQIDEKVLTADDSLICSMLGGC